jgi:glutaconyl-CoA decarboxylase
MCFAAPRGEDILAKHRLVIEGKEYHVDVGTRSGNRVEVTVNGKAYVVEIGSGRPVAVTPAAPPPFATNPPAAAPTPLPTAEPGKAGDVRAPISGLVVTVAVAPGEHVSAGTVLVVLEAMKMNNEIFAPVDGVVEQVAVRGQQHVAQGDPLVTIVPD